MIVLFCVSLAQQVSTFFNCDGFKSPTNKFVLHLDGPSAGKLYANDQILKINEEDVGGMPQSAVIQRIK